MKGKRFYAWIGMSFLSILFTILSSSIIHLPWIFSSEEDILRLLTKSKKSLHKHVLRNGLFEQQFFEKNFLLINTASDFDIGKNKSSHESYFRGDKIGPTVPITDRKKLVDLFRWLVKNEDKFGYLFCDVIFDDSSAFNRKNDDSLKNYINLLQIHRKVIFAGVLDVSDNMYRPGIFDIRDENKGIVNKTMVEDFFITYKLTYLTPENKSFPLKMYEKLNKITVANSNWGFIKMSDSSGKSRLSFNTFIPEILFDEDYFSSLKSYSSSEFIDTTVSMINLGQATGDTSVMTALLEKKAVRKKSIFIGSFSHDHPDLHKTVYGDVNGSIIILNIYYGLTRGQTLFNWWLFIFLFFIFFFISYWIFFHHHEKKVKKPSIIGFLWVRMVLENRHYLLLLFASLVSYFCFNRVINIIVLTLLFVLLETIIRFLKEYKSKTL
jgi:hypothetical protein